MRPDAGDPCHKHINLAFVKGNQVIYVFAQFIENHLPEDTKLLNHLRIVPASHFQRIVSFCVVKKRQHDLHVIGFD